MQLLHAVIGSKGQKKIEGGLSRNPPFSDYFLNSLNLSMTS